MGHTLIRNRKTNSEWSCPDRVLEAALSDEDPFLGEGWGRAEHADEMAEHYRAQTVDVLKTEILHRNEGRDDADLIPTQGNKPDLIAALVADDTKEQ